MTKKLIHKSVLIKTSDNNELVIMTNINYKVNFSLKDAIRVRHKCGKEKTLKIRDFLKYQCDCTSSISSGYKHLKFCILCEKPHKIRTQICSVCLKKKNDFEISIRRLVYLREKYKTKDIFGFLKENPEVQKDFVELKEASLLRRQIKMVQTSESYKKEKYEKWISDIPQYITDFMEQKPNYKLITISGSRVNPNIHYMCISCNREQCQKYRDIANNKGHNCPSSKSSGEVIVENFLSENGIAFKTQRDTLKCINPITKMRLPYDIELIAHNVIIEVHGDQHFNFSEWFHGTIENFEYQKRKDDYKKRFAEHKGYTILYLDYDSIKTGEYKLKIRDLLKKAS